MHVGKGCGTRPAAEQCHLLTTLSPPAASHAGRPDKPSGSAEEPLTTDERAAIANGLRQAVAGRWTIKMVCAQASTSSGCGCPYALEFKHKGDGTVTITQTEAHQFHDPSDAASLAKLKMHPALQAMGLVLLRCGVKPLQVCNELNAAALEDGVLGSSGSSLHNAANARGSITLDQVKALAKQARRAQGLNVTSDSSALAAAVAAYREQGVVPFYQPYRAGTKDAGEQPLIIILQTPWQARMLDQFGRTLAFADSTYGTNWAGYPLYAMTVRAGAIASTITPRCMVQNAVWWPCWGRTGGTAQRWQPFPLLACLPLQVQDDVGRGVPVGFMICSSDTVEVVEKFFRTLQEGVSGSYRGCDSHEMLLRLCCCHCIHWWSCPPHPTGTEGRQRRGRQGRLQVRLHHD